MEISSLSEEKLITLIHVMNNFDEVNNFFMNNYWNKIGIFAKLISLNEMEELKRFQGSTFDEDRDTVLELTSKIQELQNKVNCMNDSRVFERCRISTQWTIPRSQSTSASPTFFEILAEC